MDDLIRIFNDSLTEEYCDYLIDKFEKNPEQYEKIEGHRRSFVQLDMLDKDNWIEEIEKIMPTLIHCLNLYIEECKIEKTQWPDDYGWEGLRIKRYLPNGQDEFHNHVDIKDYKDAKRFLTFFVYLDDNEGGRTSFPRMNKHANCNKGDILIFPPMWPWLHLGEKPVEKPKYILHSYLHYVWTKDE